MPIQINRIDFIKLRDYFLYIISVLSWSHQNLRYVSFYLLTLITDESCYFETRNNNLYYKLSMCSHLWSRYSEAINQAILATVKVRRGEFNLTLRTLCQGLKQTQLCLMYSPFQFQWDIWDQHNQSVTFFFLSQNMSCHILKQDICFNSSI